MTGTERFFAASTICAAASELWGTTTSACTPRASSDSACCSCLRIVALGRLDQNVRSQLLGAFDEQVTVALPSFLLRHRVHQEADFQFCLPLRHGSRRLSTGAEDDRKHDDENADL